MNSAMMISLFVFSVTFALILTERVHRTVIALAGAVAMVLAGTAMGFYDPELAIHSIDFNTIGLLFGMMVIIVLLERTGFFQYLGILTAKKTRGNPWYLLLALGGLTSALSMILDNVTTIILIAPITIIVARTLAINPTPILLAEAILSNVGGAGTLVGDPPNIMIGSAAGFSFNTFLVHALPVALVAWVVTVGVFYIFYRSDFSKKPGSAGKLDALDERDAITDPATLKKILAVLALVVGLFFVHGALNLEPAIVAVLGAALALLLAHHRHDPQPVLEKTELSVLLFFASLFVIVGGLEHAGVLEMASQVLLAGAADNILLTAIIVLWASAVLSALVDNIPLTVAMIPVIGSLAASGVEVDLLWWALVLGVGFGGNASPIGSSAGVIIVAKSEQTEHPISFLGWMKTGIPATAAALLVSTGALYVFHATGYVGSHTPHRDAVPVASAASHEILEADL